MNRTHLRTGVAVAVVALALAAQLYAESDWPQFRGANRDGASVESGLLKKWPDSGPKEIWRKPVGEGFSAISVVGDRLYTMYAGDHDGQPTEFAVALDAASGDEIWKVPVGEKLDTEFGNGPRATPTVDGETVYVLGSHGDLAALSTRDGSTRWELSLIETFGSKLPNWGFSTSPFVDGNHLIVEGGGPEGKGYAALDKKTGDVKWTLGDEPPGYNSALPLTVMGKKRFVYFVQEKLMCIDDKGNEIWSHPWPAGETHAMPLFVPPNRIFASGAEGVGAKMFRVDEAKGEAKVEQLWETRFMRNHFSSSVLHDDHIFGFDNATLKAISVEDGKMAWGKRGLGKGSMIYADGHLLVLTDRGKLLLIEASASGYTEKGSVQALEGRCWTAPALSNGRLYLRGENEIVVYDLKG